MNFARLIRVIGEVSQKLPVIFPVHPRPQQEFTHAGLFSALREGWVVMLPPVSYLEMLGLVKSVRMVLTDFGDLREETTALGVACVMLAENTEMPVAVTKVTNTIVGTDPAKITRCVGDILTGNGKSGRMPEYRDGEAASLLSMKFLRRYITVG